MALVTIQRSPSPSTDPDLDADSFEDVSDARSQLRKRSKTSKEKLRKIFSSMRFLSKLRPCLSESYFTIKGAALILPHTECTKKTTKKNHGGEIQSHLQAMLNLLRPEDTIKIAVRLEDTSQFQRYIALVSSKGRQDTEEAVVLGIDCTSTSASIGLVLPMWMGLRIKLGGDGGFSLCTDELSYLFKPVSVQAMWSAIQSLYKALRIAEDMNYISEGLTHTWVGYYKSRVDSRHSSPVLQWNVEGVEIFAPSSLSIKANESERERVKLTISSTLKEVMLDFDLDEATSVMLRNAVEQKMGMSLAEYKSYFDEEVMRILGQMDKPSEILDFLYLGSEWNASNLEELVENGIGYILNVTKEIDNFFVGKFQYYNVRVCDVDESDLLKHWDKTYKFISKARNHKSKVLVHCKMGVSRSASTVMAFIMKDQRLTVNEAFQFVKDRRGCVHPNSGFMEQLHTYEGILSASNKRDIFRCKSEQNLTEDGSREEMEPPQGDFLGDSLFRMMSHPDWQSAAGSVAFEEEFIDFINKDLEAAESRSADSTEESMSDIPASAPESAVMPSSSPKTAPESAVMSSSSPKTAPESAVMSSSSPGPSMTRTAPVLIGRPSVGSSAWEKEMSQERGASSEAESVTALSCSEGSISVQLRIQSSGLASRIKPDSSWIKSEIVPPDQCDTCGDTLPFIDALSCEDPSNSIPPPHTCASCIAKSSEALSQFEEMHFLPANSGEPQAAPNTTAQPYPSFSNSHLINQSPEKSIPVAYSSDVHFYIGNIDNPLDVKHTASSDIGTAQATIITNIFLNSRKQQPHVTFPSNNVISQDDHVSAVKLTPPEEMTPHPVASQQLQELADTSRGADTAIDKQESSCKVEEREATLANSNSRTKIVGSNELGVRQYFIPEKIPWKPGKVRKMQEDINKTGQISQDEDNEEQQSGQTFTELSEMKDSQDECSLLDQMLEHRPAISLEQMLEHRPAVSLEQMSEHRPVISLCQSQSCVELCSSHECDPAQLSVYQREEIPLVPGTVSRLRTWLEVEDKQGLPCGEGDQETTNTSRPVDRSSSLKLERGTPRCRYTDNRRFTTGHIMYPDKSLVDLQSAPVSNDALANSRPAVSLSSGQIEERNEDIVDEFEDRRETDSSQPKTIMKSASSSSVKSNVTSVIMPSSASSARPTCGTVILGIGERGQSSTSTDSFDSDILVQEITSSLLVSSSPPKIDDTDIQPCANMVKYYVRKIEKQGVVSPQTEKQLVASPLFEMQEVTSPVSENDAQKIISPTKDEASKVKYLSEPETMSYNRVLLASLNAAVLAKMKPSDVTAQATRSTHETSVHSATTLKNFQPEINMQLNNAQENIAKTSEPGRKGSSRLSLFLKLESSMFVPQKSSPMLEDVGKISLSSPENEVEEQMSALPEMSRPAASTSPCSSSHGLVPESTELSVVRHLVGRFEHRSPESQPVSSDFGQDLVFKPKDGQDISVASQSASRSQKEYNLIQPHMEDTTRQSVPTFLSSYRTADICSPHHLSSSAASIDLLASPVPMRRSVSPRLSAHKKHASLDSALCSADMGMRNRLSYDIPVELHELPSDSGNVKDTSAGLSDSSSKRLGPVPFHRSSLESTEKKSWRSVRPTSVELLQHSASDVKHTSLSSDILRRSKDISSYSGFPVGEDDVSLRQVSDEGRKIRRLQGKSHPLTKLSEPNFGKGPFYSSM